MRCWCEPAITPGSSSGAPGLPDMPEDPAAVLSSTRAPRGNPVMAASLFSPVHGAVQYRSAQTAAVRWGAAPSQRVRHITAARPGRPSLADHSVAEADTEKKGKTGFCRQDPLPRSAPWHTDPSWPSRQQYRSGQKQHPPTTSASHLLRDAITAHSSVQALPPGCVAARSPTHRGLSTRGDGCPGPSDPPLTRRSWFPRTRSRRRVSPRAGGGGGSPPPRSCGPWRLCPPA